VNVCIGLGTMEKVALPVVGYPDTVNVTVSSMGFPLPS
jgi:hypothetical protein